MVSLGRHRVQSPTGQPLLYILLKVVLTGLIKAGLTVRRKSLRKHKCWPTSEDSQIVQGCSLHFSAQLNNAVAPRVLQMACTHQANEGKDRTQGSWVHSSEASSGSASRRTSLWQPSEVILTSQQGSLGNVGEDTQHGGLQGNTSNVSWDGLSEGQCGSPGSICTGLCYRGPCVSQGEGTGAASTATHVPHLPLLVFAPLTCLVRAVGTRVSPPLVSLE